MTTADTHDTHHAETPDHTGFMWILALLLVGSLVGMVAFMGLGGLILWGVAATWAYLALLMVMTAGG